jgi:8-oxo-dGTP pyrophosphatase MutT (NUDIX family)
LPGFKETIKYFFKFQGKNILKFVTFFLAETKEKNVQISFEHIGYEWLSFEEAMERLTFQNAKEILKKANEFLKNL